MKRKTFLSNLGLGIIGVPNIMVYNFRDLEKLDDRIDPSDIATDPIVLSIKLVKGNCGNVIGKSKIKFSSTNPFWTNDVERTSYGRQENLYGELSGENAKEFYFTLKSLTNKFKKETIEVILPGVEIARVIVGNTDVEFTQSGDSIVFTLIEDQRLGQYIKPEPYQSPLGGNSINFIHNWSIRRGGKYAFEKFPEIKLQAIHNYLLAAQEVLRQMGNMGPDSKNFLGEINLLGTETASVQGHMDYPPHIHIMHYEYKTSESDMTKKWISRLVPHFYMDETGRIIENKYKRMVGKGSKSGTYKTDETIHFVDSEENPVVSLTILRDGGLSFTSPHHPSAYSIRPDIERGPSYAVYGYREEQKICKCRTWDYPNMGTFRLQIEVIEEDKVINTVNDGYLYDIYSGEMLRKLFNKD